MIYCVIKYVKLNIINFILLMEVFKQDKDKI